MLRRVRTLARRLLPGELIEWAYYPRQGARLVTVAPTALDRVWIILLAGLLSVKHCVPGLRDLALPLRIHPTGVIWVRDRSEMVVAWEVYADRIYETPALPPSPRVIVDLGANIGLASRFFGERYPGAEVFAYEPDPDAFPLANRNVRGLPHVRVRRQALADRTGTVTLTRPSSGTWESSFFAAGDRSFTVPGITLDSVIDEVGTIDVLKVDIEGAEYAVLRACRRLGSVRVVIGEYHSVSGLDEKDLFALLERFAIVETDPTKQTFVARNRAYS